ncbi:hypothetical protein HN51_070294 [Arachis hypogaea]
MAETEFLSLVVKSLTRDAEERKEAVGLLLELFDLPAVRGQIGRIQGCIDQPQREGPSMVVESLWKHGLSHTKPIGAVLTWQEQFYHGKFLSSTQ